ncbi:hypothetical protein OQA88_11738 [Cercophora sp. LCS_1]
MVFITRVVSLTNFAVASSALAFQVFVLYPWHKQLDDDFEKLRTEHMRVLQEIGRPSQLDKVRHEPKGVSEMITGLWKQKTSTNA